MKWIGSLLVISIFLCREKAMAVPPHFTYQGQIITPSGDPLESPQVTFTLEILSPSPQECILYRETHTLNMQGSQGLFSIEVGRGTQSGTDYEDTHSLTEAFNNSSGTLSVSSCSVGHDYSPSMSDTRQLRLRFDEGSGPVQLNQNQTIASVPFAQTASTLDGLSSSDLLQTNERGPSVLNQSNLEWLFETQARYTKLQDLITGAGSQSSNASSGPSGGSSQNQGLILDGGNATGSVLTIGTNDTQDIFFEAHNQTVMAVTHFNHVGIRTTTPNYPLDVEGEVRFGSIDRSKLILNTNSGSGTLNFQRGGVNTFIIGLGGALTQGRGGHEDDYSMGRLAHPDDFIISKTTGNVGLGTLAPTQKLDVNGDMRIGASGSGGCMQGRDGRPLAGTCSSDERFKKNIRPLKVLAHEFARLKPSTYDWKTEEFPHKGFGKGPQMGFIAQQLQEVFPELVVEDKEGFLQVNYTELNFYFMEAFIEHYKKWVEEKTILKAQHQDHVEKVRQDMAQKDHEISELKSEMAQIKASLKSIQEANRQLLEEIKQMKRAQ